MENGSRLTHRFQRKDRDFKHGLMILSWHPSVITQRTTFEFTCPFVSAINPGAVVPIA